jgi:hypothetical protein
MHVSGDKFVGIFRQEGSVWVAQLTWRLGNKGPYLVRAGSDAEVREKLQQLDPSAQFFERGSHKFFH